MTEDHAESAGDVPNAYRDALARALPRVRGEAEELEQALTGVVSALEAGAWRSSTADVFGRGLQEQRDRLARAGLEAQEEAASACAREPLQVLAASWRARWGGGLR